MPGGKCKDKKLTLPYQAKMNSCYQKHDLKVTLEDAFKKKLHLDHESEAVLYNEPFQCCFMPNFVKDAQFLEGLKEELMDQIFYEKNNDLYKFQQTDDFKKISTPHVKHLRKLLSEDFLDWLREVTGIKFTNKVDLTCSRYDYTDVLLCHDDELDTRRVAFILYLVPTWTDKDGGVLNLFDMDALGQPKDVVRSLVPVWNSFVWFEVTPASHHQVSEVLSTDKTRLSINGWFHSEPVPRPDKHIEAPLIFQPFLVTEEDVLFDWINPIYLDLEVQGQIQEKFENDSEIELQGFLKEEKYQAVIDALQADSTQWTARGPPNKRHYDQCTVDRMPDIVQQCLTFLRSEQMFLTLSNLTGITLHPLTADSTDDKSDTGAAAVVPDVVVTEDHSSERPSTPTDDKVPSQTKRQKLDTDTEDDSAEEAAVSNKSKDVMDPRCYAEVRRWTHGSYTMLLDTDTDHAEFALDAMFFCCSKGWQQEYGGYTSYITKGHDEELLTVNPAENSLALVYREPDTLKFVKHVNHKIQEKENGTSFYDIHLVYRE